MSSRKILLSFASLSVIVLGGCAYSTESSNQDITFMTPGAMDARCYVFVDKLKYEVWPPQTVNIKKSEKDMRIECQAPGNRNVEMIVPATMSTRAIWGGPAGMAWDYASKSLFYYPSVIAIDISQEALLPNPLPAHNNPDIKQPEKYDLEEIDTAKPRLNSDKNEVQLPLLKRGEEYPPSVDANVGEASKPAIDGLIEGLTGEGASTEPMGKGDLQTQVQEVPADDISSEASSEPLQIYPGQ